MIDAEKGDPRASRGMIARERGIRGAEGVIGAGRALTDSRHYGYPPLSDRERRLVHVAEVVAVYL